MSRRLNASRVLSDSHKNQIQILRILNDHSKRAAEVGQLEISEIAELSGLVDEREVQRYLLILEGQKLVSPYPEGDFTSSRWNITREGSKAMKVISCNTVQ